MAAVEHQSPYVGLTPYSESDAPRFFGREREVRMITANFYASSVMLLYGGSGVGKSSVLRAGVLNRLSARQDIVSVLFNFWQAADPVEALKRAVADAVAGTGHDPSPPSELTSLAEFLVACSNRLERRLMIVLDQFEEFFLYHPSYSTFDSEFSNAVIETGAVNFLISLREEFLARLDRFEASIPALYDNIYRLEHLDHEAAHAAIVQPLAEQMMDIEPDLVDTVLEQLTVGQVLLGESGRGFVGGNTARARVETPFLQMVMTRLWTEEVRASSRVLRLETLHKLGGAQRIVSTHLDEAMGALSLEEQQIVAGIFRFLVTPSGTKISIAARDLSVYTDVPEEKLQNVLGYLVGPSLRVLRAFTSEASPHGELQYEISHNVLAPAVLDWQAKYLRKRELAEAQVILVKARRKAKRLAIIVACSAFLSLSFFLLLIYANKQREVAMRLQAEAERERVEVQRLLNTVAMLDRVVPYFKSVLRGHSGAVNAAAFSPDAQQVLTVSNDETARAWETETGRPLFTLQGHRGALRDAAFSPDGKIIATASDDGTARLWDATSGISLGELRGHTNVVNGVVFSPDAIHVATYSADGTARVWDTTAVVAPVFVLGGGHTGRVNHAAFSSDGKIIATAGDDGTARLWDVRSGQPLVRLEGHQNAVYRVTFGPDGQTVATTGGDRRVMIWDLGTGRMLRSLQGHTAAVIDAAFSPDGQFLVTASQDKTAAIWVPATGRKVAGLVGHTAEVFSAAFSPDGRRVVTASSDGTARVWDTASGRELADLRGHTGGVKSATFSPSSDLVVTASEDTTARVWNVGRGKRVAH